MESAEKFKQVEDFQQTLESFLSEATRTSHPDIRSLVLQLQNALVLLSGELEGFRGDPALFDTSSPKTATCLEKIQGLQRDLQAALDSMPVSGDDRAYQTLRSALRGMIRAYSDFKLRFEERPVESMAIRGGRQVPLCEALKQSAVREVFQWKEWSYLLQNVTRGEIDLPAGHSGSNGLSDPLLARKNNVQVRRTDDFFPAFRRSLERLESQTREEVERSVQIWLDELQRAVLPFQEQVAGIIRDWGLAESSASRQLGEEGTFWVNVLKIATHPKTRHELTVERAFSGAPPLNAEDFFPLALSKSDNIPGRAFGWDPDLRDQSRPSPEPSRHPSHVFRMRDEMITSLAMAQAEIAGEALSLAAQSVIRDTCAMLIQTLDEALGRPAILSSLVPDAGKSTAEPTEISAARKAARLPYPLTAVSH